MKMFLYYAHYEKYPWEMGYPVYAELDNILPWMIREWGKMQERERQIAEDEAKARRGS
jgi:hypothetical protein